MRRLIAVAAASILIIAVPATAQTPTECAEFEGITCDGWVTDAAGVLSAEPSVEGAAERFVTEHGHQLAVVIVSTSGARDPLAFATDLGNTWGVGDASADDGIVVLVALNERRTEIVTGSGLSLRGLDTIAASGNGYFADGDFDGGLIAIITSLDGALSGATAVPVDSDDGGSGISVLRLAMIAGVIVVGSSMVRTGRKSKQRQLQARRTRLVDDALDRLEAAGSDLPLIDDYAIAPSAGFPDTTISRAVSALHSVRDDRAGADPDDLKALWRGGAIVVVDRPRLLEDAEVPLELRVSQERRMLEDAVQSAALQATGVPLGEENRFAIALDEVETLVAALRPHRVASARRRTASALADGLTHTDIGWAGVTDLGGRFLETAPALDGTEALASALIEIDAAFETADSKARRLESIYSELPSSVARPAVAAALADVDDHSSAVVHAYEKIRERLTGPDSTIEDDGLEVSAIAKTPMRSSRPTAVCVTTTSSRAMRWNMPWLVSGIPMNSNGCEPRRNGWHSRWQSPPPCCVGVTMVRRCSSSS
jgi:uncharacterized membrane protein YgcG